MNDRTVNNEAIQYFHLSSRIKLKIEMVSWPILGPIGLALEADLIVSNVSRLYFPSPFSRELNRKRSHGMSVSSSLLPLLQPSFEQVAAVGI